MATSMQELLDVLKDSMIRQKSSEATLQQGFLLENVKIATVPQEGSRDKVIDELLGPKKKIHLRLKNFQHCWSVIEDRRKILSEAKKNRLKSRNVLSLPRHFWAASAVTSAAMTSEYGYESDYVQGSDKYVEESKMIPGAKKKKRQAKKQSQTAPPAQKSQPRPGNRSCIAKLLASNCWLSYLCWTLCCARPRCPAYTNCPCGPQGPCANIKVKPCPAVQAKKNRTSCKNGPQSPCSPCSALCGKLFGKKHVHTDCCCRCTDNPPLNGRPKKKTPSPPQSPPPQSPKATEYGSDVDLDGPEVQPVLVYSKHSDFDFTRKPKSRRFGRKMKIIIQPKRRLKEFNKKKPSTNLSSKGSEGTAIRPDRIRVDTPMSHKITKTFSTSQGPIRVEQKIELKGRNESFVIVSHSRACECNLCRAVKNQKNANTHSTLGVANESIPNTEQIDHNEDCSCTLCRVLWNDFAENKPMQEEIGVPSTLTYSSQCITRDNDDHHGSLSSSMNISDERLDERFGDKIRSSPDDSTRPKFLINSRRKVAIRSRACYCSQCYQKRDVRKLKRKLDEELGFTEFYKLLQNFSQQSDNGQNTTSYNWSSDITLDSPIPRAEIKEEEPTKQSTAESSWRPSNWAFGTDTIFMNHEDGAEEKPKIMHWLQSSPDFVKSLESKLSMFIPDPEENLKGGHLSATSS